MPAASTAVDIAKPAAPPALEALSVHQDDTVFVEGTDVRWHDLARPENAALYAEVRAGRRGPQIRAEGDR